MATPLHHRPSLPAEYFGAHWKMRIFDFYYFSLETGRERFCIIIVHSLVRPSFMSVRDSVSRNLYILRILFTLLTRDQNIEKSSRYIVMKLSGFIHSVRGLLVSINSVPSINARTIGVEWP